MIYVFHGNSTFLLEETVAKWKNQFTQKYWDFQLTHMKDYSESELSNIEQSIVSEWLFAEKKLIILDNLPVSAQTKNKEALKLQENLLKLIPRKGDGVILVFSSLNPDKRGKFYKYLQKLSRDVPESIQIKEYNLKEDTDNIFVLQKKYPDIDYSVLAHILNLKSWNLEKARSEIEKILIAHDSISVEIINENINPELEQSIFIFIENLLHNRKNQALSDMHIILEQSDIMSFYYGLLANMRVIIYILLLLKLKKWKSEVISELNLWKRGFLIDKYSNLSYENISTQYIKLCLVDSDMKSGKLSQFSENWLQDALELVILEQS